MPCCCGILLHSLQQSCVKCFSTTTEKMLSAETLDDHSDNGQMGSVKE